MAERILKLESKNAGNTLFRARSHDKYPENSAASNNVNGLTIQRKASCACGGGCPSCQAGPKASQKAKLEEGNVGRAVSERQPVRRKASGEAPKRVPESVEAAASRPGKALPASLKNKAESFFGADLGHVRLHDDGPAATAAAESRAHALAVGPHILLSRDQSDLSRAETQQTLAHEIAHTLQPSSGNSFDGFESDMSPAETEARLAGDAFAANIAHGDPVAVHAPRRGIARYRDPRLDRLAGVIESMPRVFSDQGVAGQLQDAAPGLDLTDPDNYEPLRLLLDEQFGAGSGSGVISAWRSLQAGAPQVSRSPEPVTRERSRPQTSSAPSPTHQAPSPAESSTAGTPAVSTVSMSGTAMELEIAQLREALDLPPMNPDAPVSDQFEPLNSEDGERYTRLLALESEYFARRLGIDASREITRRQAESQRAGLNGNAGDDPGLAVGFTLGFLAGAILELPRDVFQRLDADIRAHPIYFISGVNVGVPVGAAKGLWDMLAGLVQILELAESTSIGGLTRMGVQEAWNYATDPEGYQSNKIRQFQRAREIGGAIVELVGNLIADPAFMLVHGEELGEIAGRASGRWFNGEFMTRGMFSKGETVGEVMGRIIFEVAALFLGPEEWLARGSALLGEGAHVSGALGRAIMEAIEHIPALRRLLLTSRGVGTAARETAVAEHAVAEALPEAARLGEGAADATRGGEGTGRALGTAEEAAGEASRPATSAAEEAELAAARARQLPEAIAACRIGSLYCPMDYLLGREEFQQHFAERRSFFDYVGEMPHMDLDLGPSPRSLGRARILTGDDMYRQYLEAVKDRNQWSEPFRDAMDMINRRSAQEGVDFRRFTIEGQEHRWPMQSGEPWTVHHEPPLEFVGRESSELWRPMPMLVHDDVHRWWTNFRRTVLERVPAGLRREVTRGDVERHIAEFD
ncbi:MAG TPA: DUF4157 domain-containing protein [Pyrinomonadaceae bacterium]|jgi:hypothetical protein|nr:DUF4157 domain-containing protein [Pyrinomonadaceae bacterium]